MTRLCTAQDGVRITHDQGDIGCPLAPGRKGGQYGGAGRHPRWGRVIDRDDACGPFGDDSSSASYGCVGPGFEFRSESGILFRGTAYGLIGGDGFFEMKIAGNILTITVDLTKEFGPSSSGKTISSSRPPRRTCRFLSGTRRWG
jgi:hypothetical protein